MALYHVAHGGSVMTDKEMDQMEAVTLGMGHDAYICEECFSEGEET